MFAELAQNPSARRATVWGVKRWLSGGFDPPALVTSHLLPEATLGQTTRAAALPAAEGMRNSELGRQPRDHQDANAHDVHPPFGAYALVGFNSSTYESLVTTLRLSREPSVSPENRNISSLAAGQTGE